MSKYNVNDTNPLLVQDKVAKQGSAWQSVAQGRAHKQHPAGMSDDDIHAVHKHIDPHHGSSLSPEEEKAKLASLEEKLKLMKEEEKNRPAPQPKPKAIEDELLEDWLKDE